jgi:hypothetical protein
MIEAHGADLTPPIPGARLLPWSNDGKPNFLKGGGDDSPLARIADEMEADQLNRARHTLQQSSRPEMDEAGAIELHYVVNQLKLALSDVLLICVSRGMRLSAQAEPSDEEQAE